MRNTLLVAFNHLNNLRKDKLAWVVMLLLPLILSFVTGLAFGGNSASGGAYSIPVAISNLDQSPIGLSIAAFFDQPPFVRHDVDEASGRQMLRDRSISALVIIPSDLEGALRAGRAVDIAVVRSTAQEGPRLVEQHLTAQMSRLRAAAASASLAVAVTGEPWLDAFTDARLLWPDDFQPVRLNVESLSPQPRTEYAMGYNQSSPGYLVMFGLMSITAAGAAMILRERETGTLSRLLTAPLRRSELVLGKILGLIFTGVLQMSVLVAAGQLLFGVNWGQSPLALATIILAFSFAAAGLGMLLAAICKTASQANAVGVLTVIVLAMLGGTWWPLELMPGSVQLLSRLVPSGWAMAAFTDIIMRGAGIGQLWVHATVLAAFGAVFATLGARLFRYH